MRDHKIYFTLITIILIVFSIFLFFFYDFIKKKLYPFPKEIILQYEKSGEKFDKRPRFKVLQDLKKSNKNISVTLPPRHFMENDNYKNKSLFPLAGISNVETINCNENGYYSFFKSDRYGFNNPDNVWDNETISYLLLGDSFTLGNCVNAPNDISSVLRNLSKDSVLNLGYAGNGPLIEFAVLKEYFKKNTKNIIWLYFDNDITDLKAELRFKILKQYFRNTEFTQDLRLKQNELDLILKDYMEFNYDKKKRIYFKLKEKLSKVFLINRKPKKNNINLIDEFKEIIDLSNNFALKNGSKLHFVYLPSIERYVGNYDDSNYREVKKIVKEMNINFIDIHEEVFLKEIDPLNLFPFRRKGHYTADGYKKITETIYRYANN